MDVNEDEDMQDEADEAEDDCECTETALQVLEQVVMPARESEDWDTMEKKILVLKHNISQCLVLSQCAQCAQESGFSMLVLVIYERLTTAFEAVARWWSHRGDEPGGEQKMPPRIGQHSFAMGRYNIDSFEEHRVVFKAIVLLQMQRLSRLSVIRLEASRMSKWRAHEEQAEALLSRIKRIQHEWML